MKQRMAPRARRRTIAPSGKGSVRRSRAPRAGAGRRGRSLARKGSGDGVVSVTGDDTRTRERAAFGESCDAKLERTPSRCIEPVLDRRKPASSRILRQPFRRTMQSLTHRLTGPVGLSRRAFDPKTTLCAVFALAVTCVAAPVGAQMNTHGAGIGWTGSHGGVSWDGGHAYSGGSYPGFPPAYRAVPPVRPVPVKPRYDGLSAPSTLPTRLVDPALTSPRRPITINTHGKRQ